jgi:hypothetical protein
MTSIIDITEDKNLLRAWFKNRDSWRVWFVFLRALFALPIVDAEDIKVFQQCTGRAVPPAILMKEAWLVVGRRGKKSFILAFIAVYSACFVDWRKHLAPGERATIPVIARDRDQARIVVRYIRAMLAVPLLAKLVERQTKSSFDLVNSVTIEVHTASFRSTRGLACPVVCLDEISFWAVDADSSDPDTAIVAALRPAMAQFPNPLLIAASSPYARKGALYDTYKNHFGKDGDVLVWRAATRTMNPSIPQHVIDEAMERDPADASAEYLAIFRSDLEAFVNRDAVEACIERGTYERPPRPGVRYVGFVDTSGSGADSFTLAVSHRDADMLVLDSVREVKPPFSPESVVAEFSTLFKTYGIRKITGDKYALNWPVEQFRKHDIVYEQSAAPKSDLYVSILPSINSRMVSLLDHPRLINQLVDLERRTSRSGKDSVDHPARQHDDLANAVAGALVASAARKQGLRYGTLGGYGIPGRELDPRTGRPLNEPERARVNWVVVPESAVPAVKGLVRGRF